MIIGVPTEIKPNENRVAITPSGVHAIMQGEDNKVIIQSGAGVESGFSDEEYKKAGAIIASDINEVYAKSEMILKVKEPQKEEYDLLKENQILFTYLHLAAEPELAQALIDKRVMAIAYETIQKPDGSLPLLTPMSEVAGRMSVQIGAQFLSKHYGGEGILLGGVPGAKKGKVVIIGGGVVGANAAKMAIGLGADVTIIDKDLTRLRYLSDIFETRIKTLMANDYNIKDELTRADLVIGAVLVPGAKAPKLVTEEMVKGMKQGSVIVDVAIDQGGSIETIDRVTTHENPVYEKHGVIHYSVANIPGAVAQTSTIALTNATLPYVLDIANKGQWKAVKEDETLAKGVNIIEKNVTCESVAEALGKEYTPLSMIFGLLNL